MTTYSYTRTMQLKDDRQAKLKQARDLVSRAQDDRRDLTPTENATVAAAMDAVTNIDTELKEQSKAMLKAVLGSPRSADGDAAGTTQYLSLRSPGMKADLTARFGSGLGGPGMKSLLDGDSTYVTVPMDPVPFRMEQAPTSLLEILPAVTRPVVHRYMRQTQRDNNAAPVAVGDLKPTSSYALSPVDGRLKVIAHISDPIDKYALEDGPSLASFVQLEMVDGLHQAVEAQLLAGDGTGENLTGLAHTSGIQTQSLVATSPILTGRAAITKVEVLGYTPAWFVLNPLDWEAVETTQLDAGQYALNAEGSRGGLPVDSAARRLWGVPVSISTGVPAGTGWLLSNGVANLATDGRIDTEWSNAIADDFGRNQVRLRVEGRFDLAVTRPLGIVRLTLT
jgi:HK97 family phage major capsid protein